MSVLAHGGLAGAIVEALLVLAFVGVGLAIWMRERRRDESDAEP